MEIEVISNDDRLLIRTLIDRHRELMWKQDGDSTEDVRLLKLYQSIYNADGILLVKKDR